jgi:hypothetical protein
MATSPQAEAWRCGFSSSAAPVIVQAPWALPVPEMRSFLLSEEIQRLVAIELEQLWQIELQRGLDGSKGPPTATCSFPSGLRAWRRRLKHRGLLEEDGAMADWASPIVRVK